MKDLKRKIHYWCSDTMRNKITGKGVVCAVLDTGITQHPDLVGRIVGWKDCVQGKKTIYDDNGHGTHVAGIAAGNGRSSNERNRGVAYESDLLVVKLGTPGENSFPRMISATAPKSARPLSI